MCLLQTGLRPRRAAAAQRAARIRSHCWKDSVLHTITVQLWTHECVCVYKTTREARGSLWRKKTDRSSSDLPGGDLDEEPLRAPLFSAPALDILASSFFPALLLSCSKLAKIIHISFKLHVAYSYNADDLFTSKSQTFTTEKRTITAGIIWYLGEGAVMTLSSGCTDTKVFFNMWLCHNDQPHSHTFIHVVCYRSIGIGINASPALLQVFYEDDLGYRIILSGRASIHYPGVVTITAATAVTIHLSFGLKMKINRT